jgi:hypothetical protein
MIKTFSTPSNLRADRALSTAVFPPPITATLRPRLRVPRVPKFLLKDYDDYLLLKEQEVFFCYEKQYKWLLECSNKKDLRKLLKLNKFSNFSGYKIFREHYTRDGKYEGYDEYTI